MAVFVLDKRKKPLMPCSEKRARILLERGRAVVHRMEPFTIRLKDRTVQASTLQPLRLKIDPGSKVTGLALVRVDGKDEHVLWLGELVHRGQRIRNALQQRAAFRRRRRSANLRYRAPRFNNRTKPEGWLAPSLRHRVDSTASWVNRLTRWSPVSAVAVEVARFDPQALENPEISGKDYQQGELYDVERWEYLLVKWGRRCAYCDGENIPLETEHLVPRSRGGSDRISNLTLACRPCNQAKGNDSLEAFLVGDRARHDRILRMAQSRASLRDAAALNSTRYALLRVLEATGLPVETATGGRTKWNRRRLSIPKTHALDAACVGSFGRLYAWKRPVLTISARGRGAYKRTRLTRHGFPRGHLMRLKSVHGFRTGDHVRADVPSGVHAGIHKGRVAVRSSGSFNLRTLEGIRQGIHHRFCLLLQHADGYGYTLTPIRERAAG
jgi:5-methylcytosine-specific restriction endonuclease McrA